MAQNYNLDNAKVRGKGIVLIKGSFAPNGVSDPSSASFKGGHIKTCVRSAQGRWTVTLRDKGIRDIEAELVSVRLAAAADTVVQFGTFTNVGAAGDVSFIIRAVAVATETDIAADANNRISFVLVARRSVLK